MTDITVPDKFKEITEYLFTFSSGFELELVLDEAAGDKITHTDAAINILLVAKPSLLKPDETLGEEVILIQKSNLAVIRQRKRKIRLPSEAELFDMQVLAGIKAPASVN